MPYISKEAREGLHIRYCNADGTPSDDFPDTAGALNYVVTRIVDAFVGGEQPLCYRKLNEAIGVLECAKLELYRRIAAPYESAKLAENGDVYPASHKARDFKPIPPNTTPLKSSITTEPFDVVTPQPAISAAVVASLSAPPYDCPLEANAAVAEKVVRLVGGDRVSPGGFSDTGGLDEDSQMPVCPYTAAAVADLEQH